MNCLPFYLFFFGGFEDVRSETHVVQKTGQKKRTLGNKEAGGQENVKKAPQLFLYSYFGDSFLLKIISKTETQGDININMAQ